MTEDDQRMIELCNTVHDVMQDATKDLPIPTPENTRDARKKISVFTYGVISELCIQDQLNKDEVYVKYLMLGGLNLDQANTIVGRTRDEFSKREFGATCLQAGKNATIQWLSGNKDIQPFVEAFL